ncbi:MAG TPA: SPFH domain-containing protein [Herpetosiphonaceae bacterium]
MQKRKAAANVFMEQNVLQDADEPFPVDQLQAAAEISAGGMPGGYAAPAPQAAFGGAAMPAPMRPPAPQERQRQDRASYAPAQSGLKTSEELQLEKEPIAVRETGLLFWRRVVVPPNVYVVHTRIGRADPVTLGLGRSFRYNPNTDAYLVVPAAMQTIGIVANCISKEKQGINILAYVQWQINDFGVAYRKLDFSDTRDPLGIVNAQLREQAEAAIKDKIATMSVEEVLTDKEPIIDELTTRLKTVAEGRQERDKAADEGLGIKIVTVQIKEAIVSSQRLWTDLQAPFRYEQERIARISYLSMQDQIRQKELETRQVAETSEAESVVVIERTKQTKQTEALELRLNQEAVRFLKEQETSRARLKEQEQTTVIQRESEQRLQLQAARAEQEARLEALRREQSALLERARLDADASVQQKTVQVERELSELAEQARLAGAQLESQQADLQRQTALAQAEAAFNLLEAEQAEALQARRQAAALEHVRRETAARLEQEAAGHRVALDYERGRAELARLEQETRNLISERDLSSQLIARLPEIASHMPDVDELRILQTGENGADALTAFLARIMAVAEQLGLPLRPGGRPNGGGSNGGAA